MELIDVVKRLVGPVDPVGETNADDRRLENLRALTALVDGLIFDIDRIAWAYRSAHEESVKRASQHCMTFLHDLGIPEHEPETSKVSR